MSLQGITSQDNAHTASRRSWRYQAAAALRSEGNEQLAYDLTTCGDLNRPGAVVFCDACGESRIIVFTCHSRLCPDCERKAQAQRLEKYLPVIEASLGQRKRYGYKLRHVTITTNLSLLDPDINQTSAAAWKVAKKALNVVLFEQLEWLEKRHGVELLSAEEKRRWLPRWKQQLIGAIAGGEFGEQGHMFHMHWFIYSPFILHRKLIKALKELSGGKWKVADIRAKNEAADAKEVVAKYATKLTELPPNLLPKLQTAIAGQRRIRNYGCWFGVPDTDEEEHPSGCKECGNRLRFEKVESALEWQIALQDVDAWYTWRHEASNTLNLIHGNKLSDSRRKARDDVPKRPWLHLL